MRYKVLIAPRAQRAYETLPGDVRRRLRTRIDEIAADPRGPQTLNLSGRAAVHRIRSGDQRILYRIDDRRFTEAGASFNGTVFIEEFMNRRDDYRHQPPDGRSRPFVTLPSSCSRNVRDLLWRDPAEFSISRLDDRIPRALVLKQCISHPARERLAHELDIAHALVDLTTRGVALAFGLQR
ncbi:MAG: type II toxin-antitoxin system RelE family toxin [Polyangiaceae bacterium]